MDAFSLDWNTLYFYVLSPFILILRVLRKIIADGEEGFLLFLDGGQPSEVSSVQQAQNRPTNSIQIEYSYVIVSI